MMAHHKRMNILSLQDQNKLIRAIMAKNVHKVKHLINNGEDVNQTDIERRTPLHLAAFVGSKEIVQMLIDANARVSVRDNEWMSPLHRACRNNHAEIVEILLANNAEVMSRDKAYLSSLHVCAANNSFSCAQLILPHVTSPDISDRRGATPLHHAAFHQNMEIMEFLIANGAQAHVQDKIGRRPIHYAAIANCHAGIRLLVQNGNADVNVHDKEMMTPLHLAAALGSDEALNVLLSLGAKVDSPDMNGNLAIHYAALKGNENVLKQLISKNVNVNPPNHEGLTTLHHAAASENGLDAMALLLTTYKNHININVKDKKGRTALHLAAKNNRSKQIFFLLKLGADAMISDNNLETPLHYAARHGYISCMNALIFSSSRLDVNAMDHNGMTALHLAAYGGYSNVCQALKEINARFDIRDNAGRTPHYLASMTNLECLKLMSVLPASHSDAFNRSLLHYASARNNIDCLEVIVNKFGKKLDYNQRDFFGRTPLMYALGECSDGIIGEMDDTHCLELLIKYGSRVDIPDNHGYYSLHYAATSGRSNSLLRLFKFDWKSTNVQTQKCPSVCASYFGNKICLELLLNFGICDAENAIKCAMKNGHDDCLVSILTSLKKQSLITSSLEVSPNVTLGKSLHFAARNDYCQSMRTIMSHIDDLDVDFVDEHGRTALMIACWSSPDCVNILLDREADANAMDSQLRTPIIYATYSNNVEAINSLIAYKAHPLSRLNNGKTAFHIAAALGHREVLTSLVSSINGLEKVSCESLLDYETLTPIHWAALKAKPDCLSILLNNLKSKDLFGSKISPLHLAAFSSDHQCVELLISHYGQDLVNALDSKKRTVLHFLCKSRKSSAKLAETFLSHKLDINSFDHHYLTPLMYAGRSGNEQLVEYLLANNADASLEDRNGNTALHHATSSRNESIGLKILETAPYLSKSKNVNLQTPLHLSASLGLTSLTQHLLLSGASVSAADSDGLTPSLCCAKSADVAFCLNLIESIMIMEESSKVNNCDTNSNADSIRAYNSQSSLGYSNYRPSIGGHASANGLDFSVRQSIIERKSMQTFSSEYSHYETPNTTINLSMSNLNINNHDQVNNFAAENDVNQHEHDQNNDPNSSDSDFY